MPVNGHPAFEMAYNLGSWNAQESTLLFADKAYRLGDRIVLIGAGGDLGAHFLAAAPPDIRECGLQDWIAQQATPT